MNTARGEQERGKRIHARPVFERLLFSQCWEDPRMDIAALKIQPGDTLLSVTSGGCNTLSLALQGPRRIIAADLSRAQSWLLELKIAGALALTHAEYLELLGVRRSQRRSRLYGACRGHLTSPAQQFWDSQIRMIEGGLLRAGRYERYLAAFRQLLLLLEGRRRIDRLFEPRGPGERRRFYEEEWNTAPWRLFFRFFFSRRVLGRAGLDPDFFTYVRGIDDFGAHFLSLARHALVDLPAHDNYFLAQICLGRYLSEQAMPPYLLEQHFPALRENVRRIEIVTGEIEEILATLPDATIDGFNLSNVFEWVSPAVFERTLREIHRVARPGARLCYRNLLVHRRHPPSLDTHFVADDELAQRLLYEDRSFVYSNFEIATVRKPARRGGRHHAHSHEVEIPGTPLDLGRSGVCHAGRPEDRHR